mgnify:CR=1 FL=1
MGVVGQLDPRHHAGRYGQVIAALGESHDGDLVLQVRRLPERQGRGRVRRRGSLRPEGRVVDGEDGEVARVAHGVDAGPVLDAAAVPAELHEGLVGDDVRVGEDADAAGDGRGDDDAAARGLPLGLVLPRLEVVRGRVHREHLDDALEQVLVVGGHGGARGRVRPSPRGHRRDPGGGGATRERRRRILKSLSAPRRGASAHRARGGEPARVP